MKSEPITNNAITCNKKNIEQSRPSSNPILHNAILLSNGSGQLRTSFGGTPDAQIRVLQYELVIVHYTLVRDSIQSVFDLQ